jgi:outer membrane receptor protein involved in Fe transport
LHLKLYEEIEMKNYKRAFAAIMLLAATVVATAQGITGKVTDRKTKEPLTGAVVSVKGTENKVVTDIDGIFKIDKLQKGTYSLVIAYLGYKQQEVSNVKVGGKNNERDTVNVEMTADEQQLSGVTVTGIAKHNTTAAMLQVAKSSDLTLSSMSAQDIERTQDTNAGEAIRRIPGVSIIEDKFVMVRGLSQRYNNVWINDGAVPSSEADTRAFSFDIIPGSQIDNMQIAKTPAPEYPADYSGGFISINTKEIPSANAFEISIGGNWNDKTDFSTFKYDKGSCTDFLGYDGGLRSLNGGIHAALVPIANGTDLMNNHLNNDWYVKDMHPVGGMKISATASQRWKIGENLLGMLAAVNYTNEYRSNLNMENNLFSVYDTKKDKMVYMHHYVDEQYNHNVRLGAMLNFTFLSANGKNKYQLKNIFNQLGTDRYTWREGFGAQSDNEQQAEYFYRSRTTIDSQITGKHTFTNDELNWSAGYAYANRCLPDRRRYMLTDALDSNDDDVIDYSWTSSNDVSREWTRLDENIMSGNVSEKHQFAFGNWMPTLKTGIYGEYRTRKYDTRSFIYNWNYSNNTLPKGFRNMDLPTLLSNEQYFGEDKLYLLEEQQMRNDYQGHNSIGAAYMAADMPFGRLSVYAGLRYEYNLMELISNTKDTEVSHKSTFYRNHDLFPSLNAVYKFNAMNQLRASYGRSINRPEFREVSSSVFYDFDLTSDVQGNTELKSCYIDNIDLRYEIYPSQGEMISLAAFYKHFDSPIEWTYTVTGGTDLVYSYKNAKSANNYGLELDVRKDLSFIGLRNFSLSANASLIDSKVTFNKGDNERNRPMQGQSKYLINAGIFYENHKKKLNLSLLYNRIGKRIIGVGRSEGSEDKTARVPDSYEMPRNVIDMSGTKKIGEHWEFKLSLRDLLAEKVKFAQFDRNAEGKEIEEVTKSFRPGRNLGLNITYKF